MTFNPTYPEYQIKEQPQTYNPSVVCPNSNEALYQWCYQESMPISFEDITFSYSAQTKNIEVPYDNMVLSFDFVAEGYSASSYNDDSEPAWISINGEKIVNTYDERAATYSCQLTAGTCEISCERSDITNIRLTYPTELLANENSRVLSKQTIMERPGVYFCQVSYGEDCDVMYSDYIDYEKLLTINNVTYVINEDATATVLWVADKAVDVTIPETVGYNEANYPVTSISSKAFVDCTSLGSIKCNTSDVPALLGGTTFQGLIPSNVSLSVPTGSESTYSTAAGWNEFTIASDIVEYKNTLLVENQDARAGTQVELSIALKNNVNITNFQFDLVLPEGITIAQDEDGYDLIDLSTARTTARKHTIGNELQSDGSMRVICYSSSNAVFSGTEGEVMTIKLNISESLSEGEYSVELKNLVLTEYTDGSAIKHTIPCIESKINVYVYTPGDVNDDGSIDVTDISGVVNFILNTATNGLIERAADVNEDGAVDVTDISGVVNMILNVSASKTSFSRGLLRTSAVESTDDIRMTVLPFTLEAGEEKEVQILLDNPNDAFTGVQFDLYLPEGVNVAMDDEGYYYVDLGSRTNNRNHVLPECSLLEDGGLRVVCYSNSNKTFKNEEGDILVLTIVGDENLSEGVCELSIENIVLSRPDVTNNKPSDYVASILSGDGGAIPALVLHGVYTADVLDDFSTALAANKTVTSIDLTEAVSVDDSGVLTTGNPNALIYLSENEVLANESNVVCGDKCDNLVLIDGYAFSTPVSFEALQATYTRTLSNMKWNALYLPFDISVDALENCDIASFTTMNLHDDNSVTMTATINEEGTLHANTACLIRMKSGVEELCVTENNVTVWAEQNTESYTNGSKKASVTGVYSETIASEISGAYAMSDGALKQAADENQKLNPFRFYLLLTDNDVPVQVSALKSIGINVDGDETSSISPVQSTIDESHVVYDLQGRRVDTPSKGVYIVNGKKVVY